MKLIGAGIAGLTVILWGIAASYLTIRSEMEYNAFTNLKHLFMVKEAIDELKDLHAKQAGLTAELCEIQREHLLVDKFECARMLNGLI